MTKAFKDRYFAQALKRLMLLLLIQLQAAFAFPVNLAVAFAFAAVAPAASFAADLTVAFAFAIASCCYLCIYLGKSHEMVWPTYDQIISWLSRVFEFMAFR